MEIEKGSCYSEKFRAVSLRLTRDGRHVSAISAGRDNRKILMVPTLGHQ